MFTDYPILAARANTTSQWLGNDSAENFCKNKNIIGHNSVTYTFNEHGFRCDSFSLPSDFPVIFVGCSITEGVGVNYQDIWAYQLLSQIRNHTKKVIPYWNIGFAGAGIDTNANMLYKVCQLIHPKLIIIYSAPLHRREFNLWSNEPLLCGPWTSNQHIVPLISDEYFSMHQAKRSLNLIESLRSSNLAQAVFSIWDHPGVEDTATNKVIANYKNFINVKQDSVAIDVARDMKHPGPNTHSKIAKCIWGNIQHHVPILAN